MIQLLSSLAMYECMFKNSDGSNGAMWNLHEIFTKIGKQFFIVPSIALKLKVFQQSSFNFTNKAYVDDYFTGEESTKLDMQWEDEIKLGDFNLKDVSFSK